MSKPTFDELRERLLHAGIAPSHVRRYVRELRDHYDDLYQAELAAGLQPTAAEHSARANRGDDDALAESVLLRPELRSIAARYPALVFGIAPFVVWLVVSILALLALQNVAIAYDAQIRAHMPLERLVRIGELYCLVWVRVLPMLLSAAVLWSAGRRRSSARWPTTGAVVVTLAAASIAVVVSDGQVGLMTSLLPGFRSRLMGGYHSIELSALAESVARASWMLALTLVPYRLWLARRARVH